MSDEVKKEAPITNHRLLHILWTKAVGTAGYVKKEWQDLEQRLLVSEQQRPYFLKGCEDEVRPLPILVPDDAQCQEASPSSLHHYVPCRAKATALIYHDKDHRSYWMCPGCAYHNVKNRGGLLVAGAIR